MLCHASLSAVEPSSTHHFLLESFWRGNLISAAEPYSTQYLSRRQSPRRLTSFRSSFWTRGAGDPLGGSDLENLQIEYGIMVRKRCYLYVHCGTMHHHREGDAPIAHNRPSTHVSFRSTACKSTNRINTVHHLLDSDLSVLCPFFLCLFFPFRTRPKEYSRADSKPKKYNHVPTLDTTPSTSDNNFFIRARRGLSPFKTFATCNWRI